MLQKNYTNPLDKGRYGFSSSGKFNAPYKLETFLISVAAAAGIVGITLVIVFAVKFVRSNPTGVADGTMFEAMVGGLSLLVALLIAAATGVFIKVIAQGYTCSYIADEEKFMLDYGGSHKTIYYSEVQNIHFMPRSFFKRVHGYTITVKISGADEEYAVTSDGYLSESATPFYILKERVEMIRHEEEVRRTAVQAVLPGTEPLKPVKREEVSLQDKVASLLGKDSEMPGISARTRPDIVAVNKAKSDPVIPDMPDIAGKVSPTVNGYADDMPAVGSDGKVIGAAPVYIGVDGRETNVRDIIAAGTFREVMKPGKAVAVAVTAVIVYAFLCACAQYFGARMSADVGLGGIYMVVFMIIMILVAPFYAGTIINFMKSGDMYTYKANRREFVVTSKLKKEDKIVYSDVQDVVYKKMEFLWFIKGYRVEILTRYGVIKYNYVCEGTRLPDTSALPFEVIRERISK